MRLSLCDIQRTVFNAICQNGTEIYAPRGRAEGVYIIVDNLGMSVVFATTVDGFCCKSVSIMPFLGALVVHVHV